MTPWAIGNGGTATALTRHELSKFCRGLLESQDYRDVLEKSLKDRTLPPALEQMIWHYAYGKPVENVNVAVTTEDLSSVPTEELVQRYQARLKELEEVSLLEGAIPAEFKTAI